MVVEVLHVDMKAVNLTECLTKQASNQQSKRATTQPTN
jgi:hypothetical protein